MYNRWQKVDNKVINFHLRQCPPAQEVQETIDAVAMDHIHGRKHRYKVMFVCGDQQTYDRMWELKRLYPEQYKWLEPDMIISAIAQTYIHAQARVLI